MSNKTPTTITENLCYGNYVIRVEQQSQIDPDAVLTVERGVSCPRCKKEHGPMKHGEGVVCGKCNLGMARWGNLLRCSAQSAIS